MESMQHNNETPLGTTTGVIDDTGSSSINGRKGPSYDWQSLLVPAEPVFEASLQMILAEESARTTASRAARRRS
jgi:hypothetical protein